MDNQLSLFNMLHHVRHDYLNKLQLIKGNIQLNNFERAEQIIDEVANLYFNETKLISLKMFSLAKLLITFNWEQHHFILNYEVLSTNDQMQNYEQRIVQWLTNFFKQINSSVDKISNNELSIIIDNEDDSNRARFHVDFTGKLTEHSNIRKTITEQNSQVKITNFAQCGDDFQFTVYF